MERSCSMPGQKDSPIPEMAFFSFWKPDPIPSNDTNVIVDIRLLALGSMLSVTKQLLNIKQMKIMLQRENFSAPIPMMRLYWDVHDGVVLQYRTETIMDDNSNILSINAISATTDCILYRLYVQLYERFGVVLLDEVTHNFYTPKMFKKKIK